MHKYQRHILTSNPKPHNVLNYQSKQTMLRMMSSCGGSSLPGAECTEGSWRPSCHEDGLSNTYNHSCWLCRSSYFSRCSMLYFHCVLRRRL